MNLMSIDGSTKSTGVAIYQNGELVHYECVTSASQDMLKRVKIMTSAIEELYKKYEIDTVVMEEVLPEDVKHNQKVFKALHYLQASVVLKLHDYKQKVELMNVNTWRKTCGITIGRYGVRQSAKAQDIAFVKKIFNIDANDDICDAICIGWAYLNGGNPAPVHHSTSIGAAESAF